MCFLISTQTIDEPVRPEEGRGRAKSGAGKVATFPLFSTPLFLSAGLLQIGKGKAKSATGKVWGRGSVLIVIQPVLLLYSSVEEGRTFDP